MARSAEKHFATVQDTLIRLVYTFNSSEELRARTNYIKETYNSY